VPSVATLAEATARPRAWPDLRGDREHCGPCLVDHQPTATFGSDELDLIDVYWPERSYGAG